MAQEDSRHQFSGQAAQAGKTTPDVKDRGFTLLSPGTLPESDVFFIHGLQGHPRATWTYPGPLTSDEADGQKSRTRFGKKIGAALGRQRKAETQPATGKTIYWPQDLLPKTFPNIRIFTYGYDSHVTNWFKGPAMQLDIFSYGESLLSGLEARRREYPDRPLIFIVHSLGGLILKDALRRSRSSNEQRFRAIHTSTKAIFFLGTPHRGGSYVNLGLTAQKLLVCSGFDASDKLLRDLKFDSSTAKLLSEEFSKVLDEIRPKVYTFQEAIGLSGFGPLSGKVVEDASSALDYALQEKDFIYSNHVNMCRFSGFEDDGYEKITAALSHCLSDESRMSKQMSEHSLYQRILASLYLPDLQERFDQVEDAYEGTFGWLFEKTELGFVKWLQSGSGIFWISGKPASGKSTLLKYAVSNPKTYKYLLQNNPGNRWICGDFFFTNRGKQNQKSIDGLLQRILYQLLSQCEGLAVFTERLFKEHADVQGNWLLIYLEDALMRIVQQRKLPVNICLFIDALDEHNEDYYENHFRLVQLLQNLSRASDGKSVKVMLCLTSRPENIFLEQFQTCPGFPIHEHTHIDIQTYVKSRMDKYLSSRPDLYANAPIMTSLSQTFGEVIRRAQGVFLWVKLVVTDIIEGLIDGDSPSELQRNLSSIPGDGDLQELYAGILLRLRPNYLCESFLMLHIAFSASEPMSLRHFFQAFDYTHIGSTTYDWVVPPVPVMERKLLSRCRGFLEVQKSFMTDEAGSEYHGPIVQFLHQSVKDFLRESQSFENMCTKLKEKFPNLQTKLSYNGHAFLLRFRICQHLRRYGSQPSQIKQLPRFDLRKFDVLYHAYMVEITLGRPMTQPLDQLSDFADENGLVPFYMRHGNWFAPESWRPTFLVLAVQAGLTLYVQYVLENRVNIRALEGRPLLHYSALPMPESLSSRHTDPFLRSPNMVKLLVQMGADVHCKFEGRTAFTFVFKEFSDRGHVTRGQLRLLETLLKLGSSTETPVEWISQYQSLRTDVYGHPNAHTIEIPITALQIAVRKDDLEAAKLLLRFNSKIEALTEDDWKFLRKGYIYGDKPPEFEDTHEASAEEQLQDWYVRRAHAISEGRNKKPMLRLIETGQNSPSRRAAPGLSPLLPQRSPSAASARSLAPPSPNTHLPRRSPSASSSLSFTPPSATPYSSQRLSTDSSRSSHHYSHVDLTNRW